MSCRQKTLVLSSLPLEVLLKIADYLHFADLWYLATASRSCRKLAHHIIWHKYGIDLYKPRLNAFNHLVHAAVAYVCRHGHLSSSSSSTSSTLSSSSSVSSLPSPSPSPPLSSSKSPLFPSSSSSSSTDFTNHLVLQSVANRLAVEIYDRSPLRDWEPCLDFLVDKTLGILLDHVLLDTCLDTIPDINISGTTDITLLTSAIPQIKQCPYSPTRMGKLITDFLTTLYPTLMALFDDHAASIHHRLLINHLNRHLDALTHRYHYHHKRRLDCKHKKAWHLMNRSVRHSVLVLVRFIGTLVQTDLLTANDLRVLTHQRIVALFLVQQCHQQDENSNKLRSMMASLSRRGWMDEIQFQMTILLDLVRAIIGRQSARWDADLELDIFASMLKNAVTDFMSCQSSTSHPFSCITTSNNNTTTTTTATTTTSSTPSTSAATSA
ncbi:uncharacterized protein BX664DRAFT_361597 [Halteromyces radiatus]|uniref:uncharacterized protein n=1 Tax=Halteromyces radiatus TaxID=101107 RepID=UPI00221E9238|nr:uncharacterized protein BX664DRAFT_361597 [Halteromyces radiatus]KAI8081431.1 hypothetical protein BX664DRAFT_361597 [Halteromyces radiatus]